MAESRADRDQEEFEAWRNSERVLEPPARPGPPPPSLPYARPLPEQPHRPASQAPWQVRNTQFRADRVAATVFVIVVLVAAMFATGLARGELHGLLVLAIVAAAIVLSLIPTFVARRHHVAVLCLNIAAFVLAALHWALAVVAWLAVLAFALIVCQVNPAASPAATRPRADTSASAAQSDAE